MELKRENRNHVPSKMNAAKTIMSLPKSSFRNVRKSGHVKWDTLGKKPNDPVEGFRVPLFGKRLIRLSWRSPLGTAKIY